MYYSRKRDLITNNTGHSFLPILASEHWISSCCDPGWIADVSSRPMFTPGVQVVGWLVGIGDGGGDTTRICVHIFSID